MRNRITFRQVEETRDTAMQPVRTWSAFMVDVPASVERVTGGEIVRGRQMEATVTDLITIRTSRGIDPKMQIVCGEDTYGIVHIDDTEIKYTSIQAKRVANNG